VRVGNSLPIGSARRTSIPTIAERSSNSAGHIRVTYPAIRLVKTDTNEHLVCLALGNATLPAFQQLLHNTSKNTFFDSHNHLPKPFG
jgi:hypothetical protein